MPLRSVIVRPRWIPTSQGHSSQLLFHPIIFGVSLPALASSCDLSISSVSVSKRSLFLALVAVVASLVEHVPLSVGYQMQTESKNLQRMGLNFCQRD